MAMNVGLADGDGEEQLNNTINTTPLVDVMLVLLIIFLITIPVVTQTIKLELPKERNLPTQTKPENIVIAVNRDGEVYWGLERMPDIEALVDRLKVEAVKEPQPEVHIRGDLEVRYESVGRVVVACQRAGIFKVGFITEPPAGPLARAEARNERAHHGNECRISGGDEDESDGGHQHHAADRRDAGAADHVHHHHPDPDARGEDEHAGAEQRGAAAGAAGDHPHRRRLRRHHRLERRDHRRPGRRSSSAAAAGGRQPDQPEVHLRPNKLVTYKYVAMIMARPSAWA
jgi:biopolymer transport protein ExbD